VTNETLQLPIDGLVPQTVEIDLHSSHLYRLESIQQRERLDPAKIAEYAQLYREGRDLGQVSVFQDGEALYVADGFHRITAALDAGLVTLPALIRRGTLRDATLHACSCNLHGVPLTNADKRRRVLTMLHDGEWGAWSDYEIAKHCGVSHTLVGNVRKSLATVASEVSSPPATRVHRNRYGQVVTMDTEAIGQKGDPDPPSLFAANGQGSVSDAKDLARGDPEEFPVSDLTPSPLGSDVSQAPDPIPCNTCEHPLTDPDSQARGIGPICVEKVTTDGQGSGSSPQPSRGLAEALHFAWVSMVRKTMAPLASRRGITLPREADIHDCRDHIAEVVETTLAEEGTSNGTGDVTVTLEECLQEALRWLNALEPYLSSVHVGEMVERYEALCVDLADTCTQVFSDLMHSPIIAEALADPTPEEPLVLSLPADPEPSARAPEAVPATGPTGSARWGSPCKKDLTHIDPQTGGTLRNIKGGYCITCNKAMKKRKVSVGVS
jgi:hypothetical protein